MCAGVPERVTKIKGKKAQVQQGDHCHWVDVSLLEKVKIGDYLLTYQEAAINIVSPKDAKEILSLIGD